MNLFKKKKNLGFKFRISTHHNYVDMLFDNFQLVLSTSHRYRRQALSLK